MAPSKKKDRPAPILTAKFCKGCGRCIAACPSGCISLGERVDPESGLIPVSIDTEVCNGCGLCVLACPEPYGLHPGDVRYPWESGLDEAPAPPAPAAIEPSADATGVPDLDGAPSIPATHVPLPAVQPLLIKGTNAAAVGALLAGCRHFFGYPITPSTEGAELMARVLPRLGGAFVQAVSEVATVNHMYGCGGAGLPCMTFTSSPGFSLMLEGVSYMIGAELPGVIVNIMRGGPGLGNIGPEQGDIKLCCRGLGHGNTHAIVLAPADPQEMLDLTMLAFELTFRYRNPVIVLGDGYLGQVSGRVSLPREMIRPGLPGWAVWGDAAHRRNLIASIRLAEADLERFNQELNEKYASIAAAEQRADLDRCDDAEVLLVAANTPARMAKAAIRALRERGVRAGLFRPVTLWPFPIDALRPLAARARRLVVVEASAGQLEDEMRLAFSHAGLTTHPPIEHVRRLGGMLPQAQEIVDVVLRGEEVAA